MKRRKLYKIKLASLILTLGSLVSIFNSCTPSANDGPTPPPQDTPPPYKAFWVEPSNNTLIGIGQSINLFAAFKPYESDLHQSYLSATEVSWTSANPGVASIDSNGVATGLAEGVTNITATYSGYSDVLVLQVSGQFTKRTISVLGQGNRIFWLYQPMFGGDPGPHPLLLSLHGGGGAATLQAGMTLLNQTAAQNKFYVAYLEGTGLLKTFNGGACCGSAQTNNIDDVQYVRAVLDYLEANYSIETSKVFSTGFSNGAIMSHRLACDLSDRVFGIAAVGGGSGEFDKSGNQYFSCNPSKPVPVLHIHAKNDRNYPFDGGPGNGLSSTDFYPVLSSTADWRIRNNVSDQGVSTKVSASTTCTKYSTPLNPSKASAPVTLCVSDPQDVYDADQEVVYGGGHSWPGGVRSQSAKSDIPLQDFKANTYLWDFLTKP